LLGRGGKVQIPVADLCTLIFFVSIFSGHNVKNLPTVIEQYVVCHISLLSDDALLELRVKDMDMGDFIR
jgi:hypothetical protein